MKITFGHALYAIQISFGAGLLWGVASASLPIIYSFAFLTLAITLCIRRLSHTSPAAFRLSRTVSLVYVCAIVISRNLFRFTEFYALASLGRYRIVDDAGLYLERPKVAEQ